MICRVCGKPAHPNYGSRCEDCYALAAQETTFTPSGITFKEKVNLHRFQATDGKLGLWRVCRGRVVRKAT